MRNTDIYAFHIIYMHFPVMQNYAFVKQKCDLNSEFAFAKQKRYFLK